MYRIRFHGRGGQGMKTASRMLGTAFFLEGFQVQDAPRYGAERRGAPIFAYVRAAKQPIYERGIIREPDLVVVADDSLVPVPAAGVLQGASAHSVMLINSGESAATWRDRLNFPGTLITLPAEATERAELRFVGSTCAGAAARLLGVISRETLDAAVRQELAALGDDIIRHNLAQALAAFDRMADHAGCVHEGVAASVENAPAPDWIDLPVDEADAAAAAIHAGLTSVEVRTGLWRVLRPVIDYERCNRCWWVCSEFCPDSAIAVIEGKPVIDYDHCKGCLICVAQCPPHAIAAVPEQQFAEAKA
ncbi:MAG: 2-oxoacid:acceptor oxidoreductase family protein [Hydrogenophilaceae bacterium]|nr:2-oxoacid:acceptor oxidoreductase family protein [Hydrogenophilaceae bacterium]